MKLTKKTIGNEEVYFENDVKKYTHSKNSTGYESWKEYDKNDNVIHSKNSDGFEIWSEYDKNNNQIHYKTSGGYESWSNDNPNNPNNIDVEVDIEPFTFTTEKTMNKTLQERKAEADEAYDEAREAYKKVDKAWVEARKSWNEAEEAKDAIIKEIEKEGK